MPEVHIVKVGSLRLDCEGAILDARSTVTLVRGERAMIVDSGHLGDGPEILAGLRRLGLAPAHIEMVCYTHLHGDHSKNRELFPEAAVFAHPAEGQARLFSPVHEGDELFAGVRVMETPGHTEGSTSYVVETEDGTVVIAGDAVPTLDNYQKWLPPRINIDRELALASMEKVRRAADLIVPGHGDIFRA